MQWLFLCIWAVSSIEERSGIAESSGHFVAGAASFKFFKKFGIWHGCGGFRCHSPYLTRRLKKFPTGDEQF
jgi:hypothetical protein